MKRFLFVLVITLAAMLLSLCLASAAAEAPVPQNGAVPGMPVLSSPIAKEEHEHKYHGVQHNPTCTEDGYIVYTCKICEDSYTEVIAPALGHDYEVTVHEPSCSSKGYTLHICSRCKDNFYDEVTDALPHDFIDEVVEPTCTEMGKTVHTCRVCELVFEDRPVKALGHSWGEWVQTTPVTDGKNGVDTRTCTRCGKTDTREIFAIDAFRDLPDDAWFSEACYWCIGNGFMSGTGSKVFSPNVILSRAQFVQVLAKVEGVDLNKVKYAAAFSDVPNGMWYSKAVTWAVDFGITGGVGGGRFAPDTQVTRAQLAVFLRTYADKKNVQTYKKADITVYEDHDLVPDWAEKALGWAVYVKLISGTDATHLSPAVPATRAQTALIIKNLCKNVLNR